MVIHSSTGPLALSVLAVSLVLCACGCAAAKLPPPAAVASLTSADIQPAGVVVVSPHLNVSDDVAAACRFHFDDATNAPKFDFDESELGEADNAALAQIARCVTSGPLAGQSLDLVGHTDARGSDDYNLALANRRAGSVAQYLTGHGVGAAKLSPTSRGELDATGTDESGWARDRRVDLLLH